VGGHPPPLGVGGRGERGGETVHRMVTFCTVVSNDIKGLAFIELDIRISAQHLVLLDYREGLQV
jgi:hypothetical protein